MFHARDLLTKILAELGYIHELLRMIHQELRAARPRQSEFIHVSVDQHGRPRKVQDE